MNLIIDMNLTPAWEETLRAAGHTATHWSKIGNPRAADTEILVHAKANDCIVFTHDLDFGAILAATGENSPSVLQVRAIDPTPRTVGGMVLQALEQFESALGSGALVVVDQSKARVRILPLRARSE